ncbi:MAG: YjbQ family protein, partial [Aeoliella sp.]
KEVENLVSQSKVKDGFALVNAMHITASVFINDNESGLHADYERWLEELVPSTRAPIRRPAATCTTAPAKTTLMPTTKGRSWAAK